MELYATPEELDPLLTVDFVPSEDYPHKGTGDQPEIETFLGRHNRILMGTPQIMDVVSQWPQNESLAAEIEAFRPNWDFYHVRFACSFEPDRGCRFGWARIGIDIVANEVQETAEAQAIAFDLFPRQVIQKRNYRRAFKIEPAVKFAFAEVSLGAETEGETLQYEPQINASGLLTAAPAWTFRVADRRGHLGIYELFLLVKQPKGAEVSIRFKIGAEVHTRFGPIPVKRYREDELYQRLYPLTPA